MSLLSCSRCSLNPNSWGTVRAVLLSSGALTWAIAVLDVAPEKQHRQGEMCSLSLDSFCFITVKSLQPNIHSFVFNLAVLLSDLLSCLQLTGCHEEVTRQWHFVCHGPILFELDFYLVMNQATGVQSGKRSVPRKQAEARKFFSPFGNKNGLQCAFSLHGRPRYSLKVDWVQKGFCIIY